MLKVRFTNKELIKTVHEKKGLLATMCSIHIKTEEGYRKKIESGYIKPIDYL